MYNPYLKIYFSCSLFFSFSTFSEHLIYGDQHYFVNGAGSMVDYVSSNSNSDAKLIWAGEGYSAFATASITSDSLMISYIDINNDVKYNYELTNPFVQEETVTKTKSTTGSSPDDNNTRIMSDTIYISCGLAVLGLFLVGGSTMYNRRNAKKMRIKAIRRKKLSLSNLYTSIDSTITTKVENRNLSPYLRDSTYKITFSDKRGVISLPSIILKEAPFSHVVPPNSPVSPEPLSPLASDSLIAVSP